MSLHRSNNYAFIDAQNVHRRILSLGWVLDWKKFIVYLREKYQVTKAFVFIGFIPSNQHLYTALTATGYTIIFKPVLYTKDGSTKGNCDADMVLTALIEISNYHKAILVTSDGDFYSLVRFLREKDKLGIVLTPDIHTCSILLKREAGRNNVISFAEMKEKLKV